MAISSGQFTISDLNDVNISTTQPSSPVTNQLWLDISLTPNKMKRWNGTAWVDAGFSQDDITNYVASRGENLVTNGTGLLANNTNFSGFVFDGSDSYAASGSMTDATYSSTKTNDELIPVTPTNSYRFSFMAKTNPHVVGAHSYGTVTCYDSDKNTISPPHVMYKANTLTTLATDLKAGDLVINLTAAANWQNAGGASNGHTRSLLAWNYVNSKGYLYPPLTYSRNWYCSDAILGLWLEGSVNTGTNIITLRVPWSGVTIAAGTQVSNGNSGGSYNYCTSCLNTDIPATWTLYTGIIAGIDYSGTNIATMFKPATAFVKIGWLNNRDVAGSKTWFSNISFNIDVASQTSVDTINLTLADIASDSKLTPDEKQAIKKEWDIIVAEKSIIDAQADVYHITTEKTDYGTAYTTLSTYITPLLTDLTTTSAIVGTTFRANFADYYTHRTTLQQLCTGKTLVGYINAGIRTVTFDAGGLNPTPAQTAFGCELYDNGALVASGSITYSWSASGHLSGTTTTSTFTPVMQSSFSATLNTSVSVTMTYSGQTIKVMIPINVIKTGTAGTNGTNGTNGANAIIGVLSNESQSIPTDKDGLNGNFAGAVSTIYIYEGATDVSASWTVAQTRSAGLTVTEATSSKTATVTAMTTDTGYVDFVATRAGYSTITKRFSLDKNKQGLSANSYWLVCDVSAIAKSIAGAYTPITINATAKSQVGSGSPANYSGRFIISDTPDGTTYTARYTSGGDEATKNYTPSAGMKALKVQMYLAGGITTLLDEQVIPIVSDGATGAGGTNGVSALTAILSNETHGIPTDSAGGNPVYTGSGTIIHLYEGVTELTYDAVGTSNSTWKVVATGTNITPSSPTDSGLFATYGVHSAITADTASISYLITGKRADGTAISITKTQTFNKIKAGSTGADATAYWLVCSTSVISKTTVPAFNPSSLNFSAMKQVGIATPVAYQGRYKIYENGSGTASYTSSTDELLKAYSPSGYTVTSIKVELYLAGGTTTKIDEQTIPVVVDGTNGTNGTNGSNGTNGDTYQLNISGGTLSITYAADGSTPTPSTSAQFTCSLLKNGSAVTPTSYAWSSGGHMAGSVTTAGFTPTIDATYNGADNNNFVSLSVVYSGITFIETIAIAVAKNATGLPWIDDWNTGVTLIKNESINTPRIFAGTNSGTNLAPNITGIAIGKDVLGGTETKIGIVGYKNNSPTFQLKTDGTFNFADKIIYDGTNFSINSDVVKLSLGQIGGENLLKNPDAQFGTTNYSTDITHAGDYFVVDSTTYSYPVFLLATTSSTPAKIFATPIIVEPNSSYTITYEVQSFTGTPSFVFSTNNGTTWNPTSTIVVGKNAYTLTTGVVTTSLWLAMQHVGTNGQTQGIRWNHMMVQKGDTATGFVPNANEVKGVQYTFDGNSFTIKDSGGTTMIDGSGVRCSAIRGDTLTLGGAADVNGVFNLLDNSGNTIALLNRTGIATYSSAGGLTSYGTAYGASVNDYANYGYYGMSYTLASTNQKVTLNSGFPTAGFARYSIRYNLPTSQNTLFFDYNGTTIDISASCPLSINGNLLIAWQDYTPTFTNINIGSTGTTVTRYCKIGGVVHYEIDLTFGGTGISVSSGARISLPLVPSRSHKIFCEYINSGDNFYMGVAQAHSNGSLYLLSTVVSGTNMLIGASIAASTPFTWSAGDVISIHGSYETA